MKSKRFIVIGVAVMISAICLSFAVTAKGNLENEALENIGVTFKNREHIRNKEEYRSFSLSDVSEERDTFYSFESSEETEYENDINGSSSIARDSNPSQISEGVDNPVVASVNDECILLVDVELKKAIMEFTNAREVDFEYALSETIKSHLIYQEAEKLDLLLNTDEIENIRNSQLEAFEKNPKNSSDAEDMHLSKAELVDLLTEMYVESQVYSNYYGEIVSGIILGKVTFDNPEIQSLIVEFNSENDDAAAIMEEIFNLYLDELIKASSIEIYKSSYN